MRISTFLQAAAICCGLVFTACSCSTEASVQNEFLNTSNIPAQFFTVDGNADTILKTSHASLIRIQKGTFDGVVDIEVKEVFTSQEIFQSGLNTISDGNPLRSAGMIYFNATQKGEKVEPSMPVSIGVATKSVDTAMKLFKGEWTTDSTINWTDPQPLDLTRTQNDTTKIDIAAIFHSKCTSCHHVFKDLTGPSLRGFNYRGPWKNPLNTLAWLNNPAQFMFKDQYTKDLKNKFGSLMTAYPDLNLDFVVALSDYVNEVTPEQFEKNQSLYFPKFNTDTSSSGRDCGADTIYVSAIAEDFSEYDTTMPPVINETALDSTLPANSDELQQYFDELNRQRYEFNIEANGWYNIDAFLKPSEEIKDVRLHVQVNSTERTSLNTLVFVPAKRAMLQSTVREAQLYKFIYNKDGKTLPLSVGYRAIALTFGSIGDKLVYGIREFTINTDQTIEIDLQETTKEKFKNILQSKNIDGVTLEAIEKQRMILPKACDDN